MSSQTPVQVNEGPKKYRPYVPENMEMREFTFRALLIGLVMTVILGSANAYLGLRAGMTIAATYPAAVIGMAVLRLMKGSLLEENIARTVGSIGNRWRPGRSSLFLLLCYPEHGRRSDFTKPIGSPRP
ncbi:MAG TPA: OPT/YSL family transporter [Terriglobales bacterium]|nr:OPT/YSL family transporter [Terriglobales bacterium]